MFRWFRRWLDINLAGRRLEEAHIHFNESRLNESLLAFQEAFAAFTCLGHARGILTAAAGLAAAHYYLGDARESERYARLSLRISRRIGDRTGICRALTYVGNAYAKQGRIARALSFQQESLALARQIGDRYAEIRALINVGASLNEMDKPAEAAEHVTAGLDLFTDPERASRYYVIAQNLLGSIYRRVDVHELADAAFERALATARAIGDSLAESWVTTNIAIGYILQELWDDAIPMIELNLALKRSLGDTAGEAFALHTLGKCYTHLGDRDAALTVLNAACEIALRLEQPELQWRVADALADVHLRDGGFDEAARLLHEALELTRMHGSESLNGYVQRRLGHLYLLTGNFQEAARRFHAAIGNDERARVRYGPVDDLKISTFEDHAQTIRDLQWTLAALGNTDAALEAAERGRARALAEALLRTPGRTQRAGAPPRLDEMRRFAERLHVTLVVYSIVSDPRAAVMKDEWLPEIFIWVVPGDRWRDLAFHRSGPVVRPELTTFLTEAHGQHEHFMQSDDLDTVEEMLRLFDTVLIEPITGALPSDPGETVILVPDRQLFVVPFAALADREGKRLIERHTIAVTPSIHTLLLNPELTRGSLRGTGEALVVGNPATHLPPLPHAEQEARLIATTLGATPLIGPEATRSAVVAAMPGKRILHFATHGVFDPLDAASFYGALVFAPDDDGAALLKAEDIAAMQLDAEMAVMSACDSGQGCLAAEGLLGLSRAFLIARVPTIIATLWKIPDDATALLMPHFYEELDSPQHRGNQARALRQAMLATMKIYESPRDWAGFILIGPTA
jgi:CHAT domain-containing protein/tetratricopeptide (TPR) repeat protein